MKSNKKICQVIILPTDNLSAKISKGYTSNDLFLLPATVNCIPQHIYLISNEPKIKLEQGESYFYVGFEASNKGKWVSSVYYGFDMPCEKYAVIATTDISLNLLKIPQSFINKYVESNGSIDNVEIELITGKYRAGKHDNPDVGDEWIEFDNPVIKTNSNNEVIITKEIIKKSNDKFNKYDWYFERSSGYAGYRNRNTKEWIYDNEYEDLCKVLFVYYKDGNTWKEFIENKWYICTYDLMFGDVIKHNKPSDMVLYQISHVTLDQFDIYHVFYSNAICRDGSAVGSGEITNGNIHANLVPLNKIYNLNTDEEIKEIKNKHYEAGYEEGKKIGMSYSIEFAEWLHLNGYISKSISHNCYWIKITVANPKEAFTTKELFDKWLTL